MMLNMDRDKAIGLDDVVTNLHAVDDTGDVRFEAVDFDICGDCTFYEIPIGLDHSLGSASLYSVTNAVFTVDVEKVEAHWITGTVFLWGADFFDQKSGLPDECANQDKAFCYA